MYDHREVGVGTEEGSTFSAATISSGKCNEVPTACRAVAAGELSPVEERRPEKPKLNEVVDEIARFRGTTLDGAYPAN